MSTVAVLGARALVQGFALTGSETGRRNTLAKEMAA